MTNRNLSGKVVMITGSARGIGAATARAFANEGAKVVISDIDAKALAEAAESLQPALALPFDVSDRAAFDASCDRIEAEVGPIDILVNNAGIMPVARVNEIPQALADRVLDVNVKGVVNGTRAALDRMLPRRRGHIINISSAFGEVYSSYLADYIGSKHFVVGFTDAARMELHGSGVDVSVVLPGQVETGLTAGLIKARGFSLAKPEQIAAAIVQTARRPRRHTYVPWTFSAIVVAVKFLPKALTEPLLRVLGANKVINAADPAVRTAYNERALVKPTPTSVPSR
ncbi:SDR family oxidoreductase [Mycolicibacterium psychrotolerans]|uniref:Short-chain dehydrogenase n=1 Tax=Mycolicibacterium psychrotolerans TaxID=216929 RepID=A0A7I7M6E7_9MYCO|nr:SDR family oxidoreductase [Mycolicibacterium psychrotolerans]BBX67457.1 short-chain dehydrogenase [Mycolicibacterium psychrotolerans]